MAPPPKKRKMNVTAPESITFDPAAREEYLTGFHKRKLERIKHAQDENAKREKEEKLRFRRKLRQQRKDDLERHVAEVNRLVRQANGEIDGLADSSANDNDDGNENDDDDDDEEEFQGFAEPEPINQEDEYIDEDKYTTVTIESVNVSKAGFTKPGELLDDEDARKKGGEEGGGEAKEGERKKRVWTKAWPKSDKPKKKKPKFRYETKAERKMERMKQGAKKRKQKEARTKAQS